MVMPAIARKMVTIAPLSMEEVGRRILGAPKFKVPATSIKTVIRHLVAADLAFYESHGIMRLRRYLEYLESKAIKPRARLKILKNDRGVALLDGNRNFGQVTMERVVQFALAQMKQHASVTVLVRGCNHVGRLGEYLKPLAEAGFIARLEANAVGRPTVTVHGSLQALLGTEPLAFVVPVGKGLTPLLYDASTAIMVEGNFKVAHTARCKVPLGLLFDRYGQPTDDPGVLYLLPGQPEAERGCVLPMGGIPQGYRGSGYAIAMNCVSGILSGTGVNPCDTIPGTNGIWLYVLDPRAFMELDEFTAQVRDFIAYLKGARPCPGAEILMPGEGSALRTKAAYLNGAKLDYGVWMDLQKLAAEHDVSLAGIEVQE